MLEKAVKAISYILVGGILLGSPTYALSKDKNDSGERKEYIEGIIEEFNKISIEEGKLEEEVSLKKFKTGEYSFDLDRARIINYELFDNDKGLVVYVKDLHYSDKVQESIYHTLHELIDENSINLLLLENITKDEIIGEKMADMWEAVFNYDAGGWVEYEYKDKIATLGAESDPKAKKLRKEGDELFRRIMEGEKEYLDQYRKKDIIERSEVIVEKIIKEMEKRNKDAAILICGGGHTRSLVQNFEKNHISYIVIEANDYKKEKELALQKINNQLNIKN